MRCSAGHDGMTGELGWIYLNGWCGAEYNGLAVAELVVIAWLVGY